MKSSSPTFETSTGHTLSARLDLPAHQKPTEFVLFAHCFTCGKNLPAIRSIVHGLTDEGFGVMSFDFTGLGNSEGDFSDTNFSTQLDDLVCAARYLEKEYSAPTLLVGHSLGGAAVLALMNTLPSVKAIATIGAPAQPEHVKHLIDDELDTINEEGEATVKIGPRPFKIKKQFLKDIESYDLFEILKTGKKAILILHSPQDEVVSISNAELLYKHSRHPKSYISLDGANHLLTNKKDAAYVGQVIGSWAKRYLAPQEQVTLQPQGQVMAYLEKDDIFTTHIATKHHSILADEPEKVGGNNFGPSPYDLLLSSLGACTAMTLKIYMDHKKWTYESISVQLNHAKVHCTDCENPKSPKSKIDKIERIVDVKGELTDEQRKRLVDISDRCPVHRTLEGTIQIETRLSDE